MVNDLLEWHSERVCFPRESCNMIDQPTDLPEGAGHAGCTDSFAVGDTSHRRLHYTATHWSQE